MDPELKYFLSLEIELLECCIVHFFVWNQWLGSCKNDQTLQLLLSVPPLAAYPITNYDEEESTAEATKAHVTGRVHTIFSIYRKDQTCRSIQRDGRCGYRVSFPPTLCIKAIKKYRLRECTVHLFLSAWEIGKGFAVEDSRYFWTGKRCGKAYFQFKLSLILKIN